MRKGFTLIEGLMTIAILGVLTTLAFPKVYGVLDAGNDKHAIAKAEVLNSAKLSFKMRSEKAHTEYANAGNNESKYSLIHTYIPLSGATLGAFSPKGYDLEMGSQLDDRVILKKQGMVIEY